MDQNVTISDDFLKQERRKPRLSGQEECMRRTIIAAAALLLAAAGIGAADREVLRVEYEYARPGDPFEAWVQTYFTDNIGRLTRISRVNLDDSGKPTGTKSQTQMTWTDTTVKWRGDLWNGETARTDEGITSNCAGIIQTYRLKADSGVFRWTTEAYVGEWSSDGRLDVRLSRDEPEPANPFFGISTQGSRISGWSSGFEEYRILLDRRPNQLGGILVAPFLDDSGWYTCGKIVVTGSGFGKLTASVRDMDFVILDSCGGPPVWQNFLLSEKYLH